MLQLTINEKGGPTRQESFDKEEITIGRVQGNDIILPKGNISKRHSRIVFREGKLVIQDLKSTNGTYVNGRKISGPQVIKATDKVYIGDFTLQIEKEEVNSAFDAVPGRASADLSSVEPTPDAPPGPGASPGLIDDNFDREFSPPGPTASRAPSLRGVDPAPVELSPEFLSAAEPVGPGREPPPPEPALPPEPSRSREPSFPGPEPIVPPAPAPEVAAGPETPAAGLSREPPEADFEAPTPGRPVAAPRPGGGRPPIGRSRLEGWMVEAVVDAVRPAARSLAELVAKEPLARSVARARAEAERDRWPPGLELDGLVDRVVARTVGVAPVLALLEDDGVYEVVVGPSGAIFADREGRLDPTPAAPLDEDARAHLVHALALAGGAQPGQVGPVVDVRLGSGARVVATLPPASFRGSTVSIRKTSRDFVTLENLVEYDSIDDAMLQLVDATVRLRRGVLLSTGPGVNASATLNALIARMPVNERVVTLERCVELHIGQHPHALAFELSGPTSAAEAIRFAVAAQADRVVAGDVSADDAAPLLSAVERQLTPGAVSVAAPDAGAAFELLADWAARAHAGDVARTRRALAAAFPLGLHETRFPDQARRITEVVEYVVEGDSVRPEPLFRYEGGFEATGRLPSFLGAPRSPSAVETPAPDEGDAAPRGEVAPDV